MACPGCVQACAGLPESESIYANEGTQAHTVAANKLLREPVPSDLEPEMDEFTQVYVDFVREYIRPGVDWCVEKKMEAFGPEAECGGTTDLVLLDEEDKTLRIMDFKYGKGVPVSATKNSQLRIYGFAAYMNLLEEKRSRYKYYSGYIIQPRANISNPVNSETIPITELLYWANSVLAPALRLASELNAPKHSGGHCRWCRAAGTCPELRQTTEARALQALDSIPAGSTQLPAPTALTPAQMAKVLEFSEQLEAWVKAVEGAALSQLKAGLSIPGFKLVRKGTHRKWKDSKAVRALLGSTLGEAAFKNEPLSPSQIEGLCKKKGVKLDVGSLAFKPEGEITVAPEADERPAVGASEAASNALDNDDDWKK